MIMSQAWRPCLIALRLATALPSGVLGPVDFLALRLFAAICFALVAIYGSFVEQPTTAFCVDVVGKVGGEQCLCRLGGPWACPGFLVEIRV